jgi:hypothetical protein
VVLCVIADGYHVKACKVLSISDRLQGEDSEVPASLSADRLMPRRVLKFNPKKLTLIPPDRRGNDHFRAAILRQGECQFITSCQWEVADHTGANARKVSDPSGAGFIVSGQLAMDWDNHLVSGNPPLLMEISSKSSH